jgi:DNA-binding transcriptional ArsR family regulator
MIRSKTVDTLNADTLQIESKDLRRAALCYRAINHPLRQQMLRLLDKEGRMPVTPIYLKLRLEQSVCSQQLAILRKASLVLTVRNGKQVFYSVNYQQLRKLHEIADQLL